MGGPGEFDRLWILGVAGDVVVLTVTADAGVPPAALDRLTGMVESAECVPRSLQEPMGQPRSRRRNPRTPTTHSTTASPDSANSGAAETSS